MTAVYIARRIPDLRFAYTIGGQHPVVCTYIGDEPLFYDTYIQPHD